jgi:hypothetical protein
MKMALSWRRTSAAIALAAAFERRCGGGSRSGAVIAIKGLIEHVEQIADRFRLADRCTNDADVFGRCVPADPRSRRPLSAEGQRRIQRQRRVSAAARTRRSASASAAERGSAPRRRLSSSTRRVFVRILSSI